MEGERHGLTGYPECISGVHGLEKGCPCFDHPAMGPKKDRSQGVSEFVSESHDKTSNGDEIAEMGGRLAEDMEVLWGRQERGEAVERGCYQDTEMVSSMEYDM